MVFFRHTFKYQGHVVYIGLTTLSNSEIHSFTYLTFLQFQFHPKLGSLGNEINIMYFSFEGNACHY